MSKVSYRIVQSPVGSLLLAADDAALRFLLFQERGRRGSRPAQDWHADTSGGHGLLRESERQIKAYFAGKLKQFTIPVAPQGTDFQREVWRALQGIPYGETVSYGEIARRIKHPHAVRAVGLANGSNPLAIVIPCHRVIGSNGSLTGYGGGLAVKRALLSLERGEQRLC